MPEAPSQPSPHPTPPTMDQTPSQTQALLELTFLTIIRTMFSVKNHVANAWNAHPYFGRFVCIPVVKISSNSDRFFFSVLSRSITGGKELTLEKIEDEVKRFFQKEAYAHLTKLPGGLITFCADLALRATDTKKIASDLYRFSYAHKDVIAPLMVAVMDRCGLEKKAPQDMTEVDEKFICGVLKKVGVRHSVPMLLCYENAALAHIAELMVENQIEVDSALGNEIEIFARLAIAEYAEKFS